MIHVTPLSRLHETIRLTGARHMLTLMSVDAVVERPRDLGDGRWLQLAMHDIAAPREGYSAPREDQVASILDFAHDWDRRTPMVVHCFAGISRSTAAAYAIAAALRPDIDEDELARTLRASSPSATPNPLIVAHADRLLKRKGRMVAAIERIGRGADAFEGNPFFLRA